VTLPLLISVPHGGLWVPPEVESVCLLSEREILEDGDEGTAEIYSFPEVVRHHVTTNVARAIVDMNRAEDDRRKDGVVKTHTCWDVPIYAQALPETLVEELLENHYRPYHRRLSAAAPDVKLALDCHTMAAVGPPVGPDPGVERPAVCLSNGDGTCPDSWMQSLKTCLESSLGRSVSINRPFKGGYTIRSHADEVPWVQVELSRAAFSSIREKRDGVIAALQAWCAIELE
jgi:formiminoglutamase